jgi:hypothetical protein
VRTHQPACSDIITHSSLQPAAAQRAHVSTACCTHTCCAPACKQGMASQAYHRGQRLPFLPPLAHSCRELPC